MSVRFQAKESQSPGPIYLPESNVTVNGKTHVPGSHITSRPKEYTLWHNPGPGRYEPERYAPKSPAFTIGQKHKHLEKPVHTVGPNEYNLKNTIGNSNFESNIKNAPKATISCKVKPIHSRSSFYFFFVLFDFY